MKRTARGGLLSTAIIALLLATGCTVAPPEILESRVELRLVDDRDTGERYEQLSVFVLGRDDDGIDDLQFLYVVHDESNLYWKLTSDRWQRLEEGGGTWIGSSGLTMADYGAIPGGTYRLLLIDAAGERDEAEVSVAGADVDLAEVEFPRLEAADERAVLTGPENQIVLRVLDSRGRRSRAVSAPSGTYRWEYLLGEQRDPGGATIYLEIEPSDGRVPRRISGPYRP